MRVVALTGASGYIGSRIARVLLDQPALEVRGLYRRGEPPFRGSTKRFVAVRGDARDPAVLQDLLRPGCAVINCVYDWHATPAENIAAVESLAEACLQHRISRMVHCSTAVVVGRTTSARVEETTPGRVRTAYEKTRLAIEDVLTAGARRGFELAVVRPTAVFGPGGQNLQKLARNLKHGSRLANYVSSCVNDRRRMNLVAVENVVAAIVFALKAACRSNPEVFIVSDDEVEDNNYRAVELELMREFGIPDYPIPRMALPPAALSLLLRVSGKSLINPETTFACDKLLRYGFSKPAAFDACLSTFAGWCSRNDASSRSAA